MVSRFNVVPNIWHLLLSMNIYLNLFLSAIKPITFFIPCSAIILGSGLAAFFGVVDGGIFSSLLLLSLIAQITINLANDYQRAFICFAPSQGANKQKQMHVRMSMLKLILGSYFLFSISLLLLTVTAVTGAPIAYGLSVSLAIALLAFIRIKTRYKPSKIEHLPVSGMSIQFLFIGLGPVLLSYYLYTVTLSIDVIILAGLFALSTILSLLAERVVEITDQLQPIQFDAIPSSLKNTFQLQKAIIAIISIIIITLISIGSLPILTCFALMATPSLFATCMTLESFPESDMAVSQKTKLNISLFAFWVLFIVGLMMN